LTISGHPAPQEREHLNRQLSPLPILRRWARLLASIETPHDRYRSPAKPIPRIGHPETQRHPVVARAEARHPVAGRSTAVRRAHGVVKHAQAPEVGAGLVRQRIVKGEDQAGGKGHSQLEQLPTQRIGLPDGTGEEPVVRREVLLQTAFATELDDPRDRVSSRTHNGPDHEQEEVLEAGGAECWRQLKKYPAKSRRNGCLQFVPPVVASWLAPSPSTGWDYFLCPPIPASACLAPK
jgi:hypothetical protein